MNLQEAIKEITYKTSKFPKEAFKVVEGSPQEAKPYLYEAIDKAIAEGEDLDENYQLHFYGMFLLAEFQDREAFGRIMELASLPPDTLDYLIGDAITDGLNDSLYLTYNGNLSLLAEGIRKQEIDEYARGAMLNVLGQLYLDGTMGRDEWQEILRKLIYTQGLGEYIYAELAGMVCRCHLIGMMKDVEYLFDEELADEGIFGSYDSCVDLMFDYSGHEVFCKSSIVASRALAGWAMFEQEEKPKPKLGKKDWDKLEKAFVRKTNPKPVPKVKIGRNDPCPCGSGKKYKHCCMNKPDKVQAEQAESPQEKQRWLADYPEAKGQGEKGRIYLEDYFDKESIEIDQNVYLALKKRPRLIWDREPEETVNTRQRIYLWEAFSRWTVKMEAERLTSLDEYDGKFSIHYKCGHWLRILAYLLKSCGNQDGYQMVEGKYKEYSGSKSLS